MNKWYKRGLQAALKIGEKMRRSRYAVEVNRIPSLFVRQESLCTAAMASAPRRSRRPRGQSCSLQKSRARAGVDVRE